MKKLSLLMLCGFCLLGCTSSKQMTCTIEGAQGDNTVEHIVISENDGLIDNIEVTLIAKNDDFANYCLYFEGMITDCKVEENGDTVTTIMNASSKDDFFIAAFSASIGSDNNVKVEDGIKDLQNQGFTCK